MKTKERFNTMMLALMAMFMGTTVMAQTPVLVAEIDWTTQEAYSSDMYHSYDYCSVLVNKGEGLIIESTPPEGANYWEPQVQILADLPQLKEGGNYQAKVTIEASANGEVRLDLNDWNTGVTVVEVIEVVAGLHEYTIDLSDYPMDTSGAKLFYLCGKMPGTHVIKKVEFWSFSSYRYNLMVDGVQVTDRNKDDVHGTSFNPTTNTLTLNNFYLDTQEEYEWGINNNNDMSPLDYDVDVKNLTIKLQGNNTIRTDAACLYFKDVNLTITGPGELNLTSREMEAINVKNSTLKLDKAKVYARGKASALNGTGSAMTVNYSLLEASSDKETQATISGFTSFQMTNSKFEDVINSSDELFYGESFFYNAGDKAIWYAGYYYQDEGYGGQYDYDNSYPYKVKISPVKPSISTNINEAYGQRESVKGQRDERYNLSGQRVGKDYKGIVIINGKKTVVK